MKTFHEFIVEAVRKQNLYHATELNTLTFSILQQDILKSASAGRSINGSRNQSTISTTRSLQQAAWYGQKLHTFPVVIELNREKLAHNYQIEPIRQWGGQGKTDNYPMFMRNRHSKGWNEFEELIIAEQIPRINAYITKIYIAAKDVRFIRGGAARSGKMDPDIVARREAVFTDPRTVILKSWKSVSPLS